VVVRRPDGRRVWYSIAPDQADRVRALLGDSPPVREPDLERVTADLVTRYRGTFSPETVRAHVQSSFDLLSTHGAGSPMLASRTAAFAATRLDALRRAGGDAASRPMVLFVCVQNAGRSQLAAGILRQLAGDRVVVGTAGSAPAEDVRGSIVQALDEVGVPLGGEFPKPLTDELVRAADVVVTMGCGDACPVFPGRRYLDWALDDPVGRPMDEIRAIRDDIRTRVEALLEDLVRT
jgi:ArsR family transcriptional regulator